jgi:hypothetical protein
MRSAGRATERSVKLAGIDDYLPRPALGGSSKPGAKLLAKIVFGGQSALRHKSRLV